ncbi:MAG: NAD-dependent epimerase/dehydratase family protein [Actinomycetes bacterium]
MRLLVLGGTRFVGRALVETALERGHDVTCLNRGVTGRVPDGVRRLTADRTDRTQLANALGDSTWDAVVDTWASAPRTVADAAEVLRHKASRYAYVSSRSVCDPVRPPGGDESAVVVDADPNGESTTYPRDKRGGELAVLAHHADPLLLRAGLVLGPYEDIGRLPWWLDRIARGGRVVAPGRPDRPLQFVDARDLAQFALGRLETGAGGTFDVAGPRGQCTTEELLEACVEVTGSDAELVWVDEADLAAAGVQPWTQLPCWLPEDSEAAGLLDGDTSRAAAAGLVCRPVEQTVADTWAWLQAEGLPVQRADRPVHGLPVELERRLLGGD